MGLYHQSTVSGATNYNGPALNLSVTPSEIPWVLKSVMKSAGWTITQSGDGNAIFSTSGDVLTNISTNAALNAFGEPTVKNSPGIANSMRNQYAWFVVRSPVGGAEMCFQVAEVYDTFLSMRIKFSVGGFSTAGVSATTCPGPTTPGDELVLWGTGTDAAPVDTTYLVAGLTPRQYRLHVGVDDSGSIPQAWMAVSLNASDSVVALLLWDFLDNLGAGDSIAHAATVTSTTVFNDARSGCALPSVWGDEAQLATSGRWWAARLGGTGTHELFAAWLANSNGGLHTAMGVNTDSQKEDMLYAQSARRSTLPAPNGLKGTHRVFRLQGDYRPFGHPTSQGGGTNNWVSVGSLWLPYNYAGANGANSKLMTR